MKIATSSVAPSTVLVSTTPVEDASESPSQVAWEAADAVRGLNRLTLAVTGPSAAYRCPYDADEVVGALQALAHRLPRALAQASTWLAGQHRIGRIGHEQHPGSPPHAGPSPRQGRFGVPSGHALGRAPEGNHDPRQVDAVSVAVATVRTQLGDAARAAEVLAEALGGAREVSSQLTGVA